MKLTYVNVYFTNLMFPISQWEKIYYNPCDKHDFTFLYIFLYYLLIKGRLYAILITLIRLCFEHIADVVYYQNNRGVFLLN